MSYFSSVSLMMLPPRAMSNVDRTSMGGAEVEWGEASRELVKSISRSGISSPGWMASDAAVDAAEAARGRNITKSAMVRLNRRIMA